MLSAHMDEIGLIATHIDENGLSLTTLRCATDYLCWGRCAFEWTGGVIGHEDLMKEQATAFEQMFIDIGATSRVNCPVRVETCGLRPTVRRLWNGWSAKP